jgi:hypothetical protein
MLLLQYYYVQLQDWPGVRETCHCTWGIGRCDSSTTVGLEFPPRQPVHRSGKLNDTVPAVPVSIPLVKGRRSVEFSDQTYPLRMVHLSCLSNRSLRTWRRRPLLTTNHTACLGR